MGVTELAVCTAAGSSTFLFKFYKNIFIILSIVAIWIRSAHMFWAYRILLFCDFFMTFYLLKIM